MSTREWPTASERSRISPTPGGKFVVITRDKLILCSAALDPLKELDLPISHEAIGDDWDAFRSPRGKYLLFDYELRPSDGREPSLSEFESRVLWVDGEKLEIVVTRTDRGWKSISPISISDDGMALLIGGKLGKIGGPFDWPCDPRRRYCHGTAFLGDSIILSKDHPVSTKLAYFVSINGGLLFSEKYPPGDVFREVSSADGRRLAVAAYKGKGGSALLDISPHYVLQRIAVYDVPSRQWVYTLDPKKRKIKLDPVRREFALSPDGSLLSLITEQGILQVYRIPERPSTPSSTQ